MNTSLNWISFFWKLGLFGATFKTLTLKALGKTQMCNFYYRICFKHSNIWGLAAFGRDWFEINSLLQCGFTTSNPEFEIRPSRWGLRLDLWQTNTTTFRIQYIICLIIMGRYFKNFSNLLFVHLFWPEIQIFTITTLFEKVKKCFSFIVEDGNENLLYPSNP